MFHCISRASIVLFLFQYFCVGFLCYPTDKYEGSHCNNGDSPGICTLLTECTYAKQAIRLKHHHNLERCGFKDFTEIVCCPTHSNTNENNNTTPESRVWTEDPRTTTPESPNSEASPRAPISDRKSVQVCSEYTKDGKISLNFHILEGEDVERGEFPHMAALGYPGDNGDIDYDCGASLISNRYVVTAAHCVINSRQILPTVVRLGDVNITGKVKDPGKEFRIANITVHPKYKWKEKLNDIALIKLDRKVDYHQYIYPACLYNEADEPKGLVISGWGTTSMGGDKSDVLQKANLTAVPLTECDSTYQTRTTKRIQASQICAVDNKSDACQGDSGGPLQIQIKRESNIYSIVGITSFGIGCGTKYPGVYTRIYSYLDWIENIVWP